MATINEILSSEYSEQFDLIRQNMMVTSYYKYGPVEENYGGHNTIKSIERLELRLNAYKRTGNTEYLANIANFAMIEFMYPSKEGNAYKPTDGGVRIAGIGVNQISKGGL